MEVLTLRTSECGLIGKKVIADVTKMKSYSSGAAPESIMTGVFIEGGNLDTDIHTPEENTPWK